MTFLQINTCMKRADIKVSKFVLRKTLTKLIKWKVVKTTPKDRAHYELTGKRCPALIQTNKLNKKRNKTKAAKKIARGGRTMEQCADDVLKAHKKMTMLNMLALLNKNGVKCSKFVLKHVLKRLRNKGVLKIYRGSYSRTGRNMPARKSRKASK